jgi:hypothetical protein
MLNPRQMPASPQDPTGLPESPEVSPDPPGILIALDEERREVLEAVLQALAEAPEPNAVSACVYLLTHLARPAAKVRRSQDPPDRPEPAPGAPPSPAGGRRHKCGHWSG